MSLRTAIKPPPEAVPVSSTNVLFETSKDTLSFALIFALVIFVVVFVSNVVWSFTTLTFITPPDVSLDFISNVFVDVFLTVILLFKSSEAFEILIFNVELPSRVLLDCASLTLMAPPDLVVLLI